MKPCPFCAEPIEDAAIKCKHCGEMLPAGDKVPWYFGQGTMIVAFFCVGPFMLPLIWFHPKMSKGKKTSWTLLIGTVSVVLIWLTIRSIARMMEYYKMLNAL